MTPALIPLITGPEIAFFVCAPLMVIGALGLVFARKPVYSALSMAFVMMLLAVIYATLEAPFLVFVQIIVYTGAVLMMFLFVMMLFGIGAADSFVETLKGQRPMAVIASIALLALMVFGIGGATNGRPVVGVAATNAKYGGNVEGIADLLFGRYVFVFELTSALLITAALAAMILAHRTRVVPVMRQPEMAEARIKAYGETGEHPGALPSSGVYATSNAITAPALLPDGSVAEKSISQTLAVRGSMADPVPLRDKTTERFAELQAARTSEEDAE